jgi:hypothetical protein
MVRPCLVLPCMVRPCMVRPRARSVPRWVRSPLKICDTCKQRSLRTTTGCGSDAKNATSSCWINCLFNVISGNDQDQPCVHTSFCFGQPMLLLKFCLEHDCLFDNATILLLHQKISSNRKQMIVPIEEF